FMGIVSLRSGRPAHPHLSGPESQYVSGCGCRDLEIISVYARQSLRYRDCDHTGNPKGWITQDG
ncbi:hypothetical protein, partial [Acidobacterium sp. S8]|uniref:hypothetical protein n=1 Tax=Acidobacterium sp. S8 TaxID=1641854 RepID=UPI001C209A24